MKEMKRIVAIMLSLVFVLSCAVSVSAATEDVTKTFKDKKRIKQLAAEVENSCGYVMAYDLKVSEKATVDCTKATGRRYMLNRSMPENVTVEELSKSIFGKTTTEVEHANGDWGLSHPMLKVSKIYMTGTDKYRMDCKCNWVLEEKSTTTKVGTVKIYIKKNSKAKYGYVITKIYMKKTAEIPGEEEAEEVVTDIFAPYKQIVKDYALAVSEQWDMEKLIKNDMSTLIFYTYQNDPMENGVGFVPYDLDGDGIYELLIGNMSREEEGKIIYAAYKLEDGRAKQLFVSGERDRYYLLNTVGGTGNIARVMSNSAFNSEEYELLYKNGVITVVKGIIYNEGANKIKPWFETTDYDHNVSNDESVGENYAKAVIKNLENRYDVVGCLSVDQGFFVPDPEWIE